MGTIVQEYGPIYGEVVNGTVQGRPNGSVYVPLSNVIEIEIPENARYFAYFNDNTSLRVCNSAGVFGGSIKAVATSQDLASNIQLQVYSDEALTDLIGYRDSASGNFNIQLGIIDRVTAELENGQPLYARGQLMNNGTPVATSSVITCQMVVNEE